MEELKCLTCSDAQDDDHCNSTGQLLGCDEGVSKLSDLVGLKGTGKLDPVLPQSNRIKWDLATFLFITYWNNSILESTFTDIQRTLWSQCQHGFVYECRDYNIYKLINGCNNYVTMFCSLGDLLQGERCFDWWKFHNYKRLQTKDRVHWSWAFHWCSRWPWHNKWWWQCDIPYVWLLWGTMELLWATTRYAIYQCMIY